MCVSGADATVSCNNVSVQNQANSGNNALGQQGGGTGNSAASPQDQSANSAASPQGGTGNELINTFTSDTTAQDKIKEIKDEIVNKVKSVTDTKDDTKADDTKADSNDSGS